MDVYSIESWFGRDGIGGTEVCAERYDAGRASSLLTEKLSFCAARSSDNTYVESAVLPAGYSERLDFSPAQPQRAETRLVPGKAAASEEARRHSPHFV